MKRTGSIGSWVGPAVTRIWRPKRLCPERSGALIVRVVSVSRWCASGVLASTNSRSIFGEGFPARFGQPALAPFVTSHGADARLENVDAILLQFQYVTLRCLVVPHAHVHRRAGEDRLVGGEQRSWSRDRRQCRPPSWRSRLAVAGADDDEVGLARQLDMTDLALLLEIEHVAIDMVLGEHADDSGVTNSFALSVITARTAMSLPLSRPDELQRLVGGDAARDDEEDARAGSWRSNALSAASNQLERHRRGILYEKRAADRQGKFGFSGNSAISRSRRSGRLAVRGENAIVFAPCGHFIRQVWRRRIPREDQAGDVILGMHQYLPGPIAEPDGD